MDSFAGAAEMVTANTKSEWSQMINDLENVGRLDISGLVNNVTASRDSSSDHHNPSHSQVSSECHQLRKGRLNLLMQ